jgi:hypothetical protein
MNHFASRIGGVVIDGETVGARTGIFHDRSVGQVLGLHSRSWHRGGLGEKRLDSQAGCGPQENGKQNHFVEHEWNTS